MNIFDIISEEASAISYASQLTEFYIPGGAQQEFVTQERMAELQMPNVPRFRPWGTNTNPWTYSSDNMRSLAIEAMEIFAPFSASQIVNREAGEVSAALVNYWSADGRQQKSNIQNMLQVLANNAPDDKPFLHNEALGMMLNSLQLSTNDAQWFADNRANDEDEPEETN